MNAVETRGITKFFGHGDTRVEALRETDFDARFGELTFVVGPSGSGKTTLLSVVAGPLRPEWGLPPVLRPQGAHPFHAGRLSFPPHINRFLSFPYNLSPPLSPCDKTPA